MSRFLIAIPISAAVGNPLSAWLLGLDGLRGLAGWQWLFFLEGIPPVLLGFAVLAFPLCGIELTRDERPCSKFGLLVLDKS